MRNLGCTTPFGPNKDFICTNQTMGLKALDLYLKTFSNDIDEISGNCLRPCSYHLRKIDNLKTTSELAGPTLLLSTEPQIRVTKEYYLYSGLSLIAEIGGYVGLFLGISVLQVKDLIELAITFMPKRII